MTTGDQPRRRESAFTLVRRLASGVIELGKLEVQRGRQEVTENVITYRTGVVFLAIALAFTVLMAIMLMILLVFAHRRADRHSGHGSSRSFFVVLLACTGGHLRVAGRAPDPGGASSRRTKRSKRSRRTSSGRNAC